MQTEVNPTDHDVANPALSTLLILLLKGVLYQDGDPWLWGQLLGLQARVRDQVAILGLELLLDEAEGYAFLRTRSEPEREGDTSSNQEDLPRLVVRRQLSFPVSLLLALLRKKLAEFDAGGGDTRLVLSRDDIVELIRVFLPDSSNDARLVNQIEQHINKVVELGFLRRLQPSGSGPAPGFEVRRIIKAFVDAQWLSALDQKLLQYQQHLLGDTDSERD